jgi:hypothetical protein
LQEEEATPCFICHAIRSSIVAGLGAALRTKMRASVGEEESCCDAPQDAEVEGEVSIDSSTFRISSLLEEDSIGFSEVARAAVMMVVGDWGIRWSFLLEWWRQKYRRESMVS